MLSIKEPLESPPNAGKRLELVDKLLEYGVVVGALLEVIYNFELPPLSEVTLILYLIDLAKKWDVPLVHNVIKKSLESSWYASSARNFDLFLIAVKLKEYGIASEFIDRDEVSSSTNHYRRRDQYPYQYYDFPPKQAYGRDGNDWDERGTTRLYNIAFSQHRDFIQIPPHVAWALQRATIMWDHGLHDSYRLHDCDASRLLQRKKFIAENFRRIMDPKCAYSSYRLIRLELISDRPRDPPPGGSRGLPPVQR
jgi:hypothetical protein